MKDNIATIEMPKSITLDATAPSPSIHLQLHPQKDLYTRGDKVIIAAWIDAENDIPSAPIAIKLIQRYEDEIIIIAQISLIPGKPFIMEYIIPGIIGMDAVTRSAIIIELIGPEGSSIFARIDNISIIN